MLKAFFSLRRMKEILAVGTIGFWNNIVEAAADSHLWHGPKSHQEPPPQQQQ